MTISETLSLFGEIRKLYPKDKMFDRISYEEVTAWTEALKNLSYQQAIEELKRHAASSKFAPKVSDFLHKGKYNKAVDGYKQTYITDEDIEKMVVLDMDGWHNNGQYHNGGIEGEI